MWSAVFSRDGERVVTASADGTARIWEAAGGGDPIVLSGHESMVRSAAFSPDGERVVTALEDGTARIWGTTWDWLFAYLRERVLWCLTPEERMQFLAESYSEALEKYTACEEHLRTRQN